MIHVMALLKNSHIPVEEIFLLLPFKRTQQDFFHNIFFLGQAVIKKSWKIPTTDEIMTLFELLGTGSSSLTSWQNWMMLQRIVGVFKWKKSTTKCRDLLEQDVSVSYHSMILQKIKAYFDKKKGSKTFMVSVRLDCFGDSVY
jgi:hypothetical protein